MSKQEKIKAKIKEAERLIEWHVNKIARQEDKVRKLEQKLRQLEGEQAE